MRTTRPSTKSSKDDPIAELAKLKAEVAIPGYWETLQENCDRWAETVASGCFWKEVRNRIVQWRNEYYDVTRSPLLALSELSPFESKKVGRIREKLISAVEKKKPVFPKEGPAVPLLSDLVRTRIPCLYIDGVEFLAKKLVAVGQKIDANPTRTREGRLDGYFAQHITFEEDVYFRFAGNNQPTRITCEIQLASSLATRMWHESHPFYEIARASEEKEEQPEDWQWDPLDPRFVCRQLGHMLHLADGLLVLCNI